MQISIYFFNFQIFWLGTTITSIYCLELVRNWTSLLKMPLPSPVKKLPVSSRLNIWTTPVAEPKNASESSELFLGEFKVWEDDSSANSPSSPLPMSNEAQPPPLVTTFGLQQQQPQQQYPLVNQFEVSHLKTESTTDYILYPSFPPSAMFLP